MLASEPHSVTTDPMVNEVAAPARLVAGGGFRREEAFKLHLGAVCAAAILAVTCTALITSLSTDSKQEDCTCQPGQRPRSIVPRHMSEWMIVPSNSQNNHSA